MHLACGYRYSHFAKVSGGWESMLLGLDSHGKTIISQESRRQEIRPKACSRRFYTCGPEGPNPSCGLPLFDMGTGNMRAGVKPAATDASHLLIASPVSGTAQVRDDDMRAGVKPAATDASHLLIASPVSGTAQVRDDD